LVTSFTVTIFKHITVGKLREKIEVTGRRARRHKYLLHYLEETRTYCKLKEEALYLTLWRTGFGRVCGPAVRQIVG
jgi:hypothetical protein